jgi:hypothetical protein
MEYILTGGEKMKYIFHIPFSPLSRLVAVGEIVVNKLRDSDSGSTCSLRRKEQPLLYFLCKFNSVPRWPSCYAYCNSQGGADDGAAGATGGGDVRGVEFAVLLSR